MKTSLIDKQFEANLWANVEIMALCATLSEAQLAVEVEGVYGRIQPMIAHIVRSEGNYLRDLTGTDPWPAGTDWDGLTVGELLEMAKQSGAALRVVASQIDPDTQFEFEEADEVAVFKAWTVINQAINHGIEHRTQLRMLLTKLGVAHPGQSVWGFAQAIGEMSFRKRE